MRACTLLMMESLLMMKRMEFMSDVATASFLMRAGMVCNSGNADDGGDARSSPLLSVVALGSLDERVEWGLVILCKGDEASPFLVVNHGFPYW